MHVASHYYILPIIHQIILKKKDEDRTQRKRNEGFCFFSDINTFKVSYLYLSLLLIVVIFSTKICLIILTLTYLYL
jgi:hypothetical protein